MTELEHTREFQRIQERVSEVINRRAKEIRAEMGCGILDAINAIRIAYGYGPISIVEPLFGADEIAELYRRMFRP